MVQQLPTPPRYSCTVPIACITGNLDEEVMTFAESAEAASREAEQLLLTQYGFSQDKIALVMHQARIEPLSQWCARS